MHVYLHVCSPPTQAIGDDGGVVESAGNSAAQTSTSLELQAAIDGQLGRYHPGRRYDLSPHSEKVPRLVRAQNLQLSHFQAIAPTSHSHDPAWLTTLPPLSWTSQYPTWSRPARTWRLTLDTAVRVTLNLVSPATTLPPSSSLPRSQQKALLAEQEARAPVVPPSQTSPPS